MTPSRGFLILILLLAAALRFAGLSWGLRHTPSRDEQDFVENVGEMIAHRDLNHRFYEYPGLVFYILYPVLSVAPASPPYVSTWDGFPRQTLIGPIGYWAARGVIAAFGVLSVLLTYSLGTRLLGARAGLVGALLLAVSPVEVIIAHECRPDVVLEAFVLLALLAFDSVGDEGRGDVVGGLALGAAAAVKFTGVLLLPSYLVARWTRPGARWRGTLLAGLVAGALWILCTPYSVVEWRGFLEGAAFQVGFHYRRGGFAPSPWRSVSHYLGTIVWSLGPVGTILAVVGIVAGLGRGRRWLPALTYPLVLVGMLSTAGIVWHRLILSALGAIAVVAACGFDTLERRNRRLAWAAAAAAALVPLTASFRYVQTAVSPGARDRVVDWVDDHVPEGARILNTVHELGLDRRRVEVIEESGDHDLDRLLALQSDYVIWHRPDASSLLGLTPIVAFEPRIAGGLLGVEPELTLASLGQTLRVYAPPESLRLRYHPVSLRHATVTASSNPEQAALAVDGKADTVWCTTAPHRRDSFRVLFAKAERVGRVTLVLGRHPKRYGRTLRLRLTANGIDWTPARWVSGRAPIEEQPGVDRGAASQVLILEPQTALGIDIHQVGDPDQRWGFAELQVDALESVP